MSSSITCTPEQVAGFVEIDADCSVLKVLDGAHADIRTAFIPGRSRIASVNGIAFSDRGELKEFFTSIPAADPVTIILVDVNAPEVLIDIAGSVEVNGQTASMAEQAAPEDTEEDDHSNPVSGSTSPSSTTPRSNQASSPQHDNALPSLLAFDTINVAEGSPDAARQTTRDKILKAIGRVEKGRCIISVTTSVSPLLDIEAIVKERGEVMITLDCGRKLRQRPVGEALSKLFADALRSGAWFVVLHGHKSIATLRHLETMLQELHEHNLEGVSDNAKIFIDTEQHPHFPRFLTHSSVPLKIQQSFSQSIVMMESMMSSQSFAKVLQAASGSSMRALQQANVPEAAVAKPKKRKVRISPSVDIVDIAPREVYTTKQRAGPIDVAGSVVLKNTFSGIPNDKFLCVTSAGEEGRYAVGSSLGNVYLLDHTGNGLGELHAHDASVWGLQFSEKGRFLTGSEDHRCVQWGSDTSGDMSEEFDLNLGADIYCVAAQSAQPDAPIIVGGLTHKLLVGGKSAQQFIPTASSVQTLVPLYNCNYSVLGMGDGTLNVVDVANCQITHTLAEHSRKVPTISCNQENMVFSGSFDCCIRSWDMRSMSCSHTLKLKHYVTGLHVDNNILAASVGDNLYMWDVRKLNEVVGGFPQGWKGLSRGIVVQSELKQVVTASPDGYVRIWEYR